MNYGGSIFSENTQLQTFCYTNNTRYYISKYYEEETYSQRDTHHKHCIYSDNGVVAMYVENIVPANNSSEDSMYYVHTDHLGSYCAITSPSKQVVMQNRFDPWGNYVVRDFTPFFPNVPITFRGFTGHEHYPELKIINMNGRLYDPVIARFFSPDNFVQDAEFTQSFNRYSYCLNNPLKYTDPEGERWMDVDDWYLNLESGRIVHREGSKNRFNEGLIHLASDNATVGNIEKALTEKNYQFIKAAVEGGFMVDTEKQYKGWAMMQIFNPEVVGMILSMGVPNMNNLATKGTQTIPHATKNSATLLKEVQVTAKAEMQGMRSFTSSNFRFNLGKLTGEIPANSQAHHIFPQKFATRFADRGINIHHPKFGAWWETTNHLQNVKAYNAAWEEFFISNPTPTQILNKGRDMLQLYGLPVGY